MAQDNPFADLIPKQDQSPENPFADLIPQDRSFLGSAYDAGKSFVSGAVEGTGQAIRGTLGDMAESLGRVSPVTGPMMKAYDAAKSEDSASGAILRALDPFQAARNVGRSIESTGQDIAPQNKTFVNDIFQGLGQLVPQIGATLATGPEAATAFLAGQGAQQMADRADAAGATQEQRDKAVLGGGLITGLSEKIAIGNLLNRVPPAIKNRVLKYTADIAAAAGIEATQESIENMGQNLLAMYTFEDRPKTTEEFLKRLTAGTKEQAAVAGSVGGMARSLILAATGGRVRAGGRDATSIGRPETAQPAATPQAAEPSPVQSAEPIPATRPAPPGETTVDGTPVTRIPDNVTPEDVASPIPTDLISEGRQIMDAILNGRQDQSQTAIQQALPAVSGETQGLGLDIQSRQEKRGATLSQLDTEVERIAPGVRDALANVQDQIDRVQNTIDQRDTARSVATQERTQAQDRISKLETENARLQNLMNAPDITGPEYAQYEVMQRDNAAEITDLKAKVQNIPAGGQRINTGLATDRSLLSDLAKQKRELQTRLSRAYDKAVKNIPTNQQATVFTATQAPIQIQARQEFEAAQKDLLPVPKKVDAQKPAQGQGWEPLYDTQTGEAIGQYNAATGETRLDGAQTPQVQAEATPVVQRQAFTPETRQGLEARFRDLGLSDKAALSFPDKIEAVVSGQPFEANGRFVSQTDYNGVKRIVEVAQNADKPMNTLNHETIHAMRSMDMFKTSEWSALSKMAKADTALMQRTRAANAGLTDEAITEEAVAQMFADWADGRGQPKGFARKAYERIAAVLNAVREKLRGSISGKEALRRVEQGKVGKRQGTAQEFALGQEGQKPVESVKYQKEVDQYQKRQDVSGSSIIGTDFGRPKDSAVEILNDHQLPLWRRVKAASSKQALNESFDRIRTAMQDDMLPVMKTQAELEKKLGRDLSDGEDVYLKNTLMTGRVGARLEKLNDNHVTPLLQDMNERGITMEEMETYLYARHAKERNAYIASINPRFEEGSGSGMTDADAEAVMRAAEADGKLPALEALAKRVDAVVHQSLQERVNDGLLSKEAADGLRKRWKHYVPLRGSEELDPSLSYSVQRPRKGSGITARGKEYMTAFGRKTKAADIIPYIFMQAQESIVRGETNRVAQSFYKLAEENPNPDFWVTKKIVEKPHIDRTTGQVVYRSLSQITAEDADFTVVAKVGGEEKRVILNRENPQAVRVATAMRKLGAQDMAAWVRIFGQLNRYLSLVNTQLNPEFMISNAFRDLQTGLINAQQFDKKGLTRNVMRDYLPALKAATKSAFGKGEGEWGRWYKDYADDGGRVYFNHVEDITSLRKSLQHAMELQKPGISAKKAFIKAGQFVENVNLGVESAIRLATYKNLREAGVSRERAAAAAKNLTVNFNRKGKIGPFVNSLYLFYNASIQGTATMMIAARKSSKVRKALAGMVALGIANEIYNQMVSGTDKDGQKFYDKISSFDKGRNIIIMLPGEGKYIKIPMAYGANFFHALGRSMVEILSGKRKTMDSLGDLFETGVDAFNPIGGTNNLLNLVAPTIIDPLVDLQLNRDFADRPIVPEQSKFGPKKPDSQMKFRNVSPAADAITSFLNRATGGSEVEPGAIDISPETLEYLFGVATGSTGAFVERLGDLPAKIVDPDAEVTANDIPMFRRAIGSKSLWYDKGMFYERSNDIEQQWSYYQAYLKRGDRAAANKFREDHIEELKLRSFAHATSRQISKMNDLKDRLRQAKEDGKISSEVYADRVGRIRDREKLLVDAFNKRYIQQVLKKD